MVQGINKEEIFRTDKNKNKYEKIIAELLKDYEISIIAYCIMTNHSHILVKAYNVEEISKFMQKLNTKYAMYYNQKNNRVGYVYRDRYKSQEIRSMEHFYRCIEYIHDNPIKAGMCQKQEQYEYSSYRKMYNSNKEELYEKIGEILKETSIELNASYDIEFLEEIDEKIDNCKILIEKFLEENNIFKEAIIMKNNKEMLKKLVDKLKNENKISFREMEKNLNISRETLRNLLKK